MGICHGFDCCKCFGCDDEKCFLRIECFKSIRDIRPVDIGDKVKARAVMIGGEGPCGHGRAQIGAANSDIDDIRERIALICCDGA